MALFFGIFSGPKIFGWIKREDRKRYCIFFETERIQVLRRYLKSKGKGSAESMPLAEIKMGEEQNFRAGLYAWVEFTGVPEELVLINGSQYLKIRVVLEEEAIIYCYSEIVEGECFCLEAI